MGGSAAGGRVGAALESGLRSSLPAAKLSGLLLRSGNNDTRSERERTREAPAATVTPADARVRSPAPPPGDGGSVSVSLRGADSSLQRETLSQHPLPVAASPRASRGQGSLSGDSVFSEEQSHRTWRPAGSLGDRRSSSFPFHLRRQTGPPTPGQYAAEQAGAQPLSSSRRSGF